MTTIEWTDETWNPTVGCTEISEGCDHCYAATVASRQMQPAHVGLTIGRKWTGEIRQLPDRLDTPLHWIKPRKVFVDSMSDLFHRDLEPSFVAEVFAVMAIAEQHTFQVLTKRPQLMARMLRNDAWQDVMDTARLRRRPLSHQLCDFPRPNVWLGTSIESDRYTFRADHLRSTPAAVRFLSLEPLLGPLPSLDLTGIDWVICGGESGDGARPMDPAWARDTRDRCIDAGVPFLFKQWGAWVPYEPDPQPPFWVSQHGDMIDGHHLPATLSDGDPVKGWWAPDVESDAIFRRVGKDKAGRMLDGRTWDEYPAAQR